MECVSIKRKLGRAKQANTIKGSGNPNWRGGKIAKTCVRCGAHFQLYPSISNRTHCSLTCANRDMADAQRGIVNPLKIHYGEDNGGWKGGKQSYICQWCGDEFQAKPSATHKFCSRRCLGAFKFTGEINPNWKGGVTPVNEVIRKTNGYLIWRDSVFQRDDYTCQECGTHGGELNAHHIKPFAEYPELRFQVDNGKTLCVDCHRKTF